MRRHLIASGFLLVACTARAQSPQASGPDSLPRELVEGLLRVGVSMYPGDGSEFVIGRVPPSLAPFMYLPANARVLGGFQNATNVVVIFKAPMSREELRTTYARELPRLGWTASTGRNGYAGWGFMPAPGTGPNGTGLEFCHIGQALSINPVETPTGLSVSAVVRNYGSACGGRSPVFATPAGFTDMPTLVNPPDTPMNQPECNQPLVSALASRGMAERLTTSAPAEKLLEHFARQLADSGWKAGAPSATSIRRTWTHADTGGVARELTLSITPSTQPSCQEVSMQVRQVRKP